MLCSLWTLHISSTGKSDEIWTKVLRFVVSFLSDIIHPNVFPVLQRPRWNLDPIQGGLQDMEPPSKSGNPVRLILQHVLQKSHDLQCLDTLHAVYDIR